LTSMQKRAPILSA